MKAVVLYEHGDRDVLKYEEIPTPKPSPKQVLVKVKACALNHLDVWVRRGIPGLKLKYPHILGADISGEIADLGDGVEGLRIGEKVLVSPGVSCGRCRMCLSGMDNLCRDYHILGEGVNGGYAEYVVVPEENILPFPEGLSFESASAIPLVFLTAWHMIVKKAKLKAGESVFITAAGSGVSTAAIQIAKAMGAFVIAGASSDEKLSRAKELGADEVINYSKEDFAKRIKEITKVGVDLILDHTGVINWEKKMASLRWGGRIVLCGATSGFNAEIDLRHVFFKQLSIIGSTMGSKGDLFEALELVRRGILKPVVYKVLPLKDAKEGHRILEEREVIGKVVLKVE